MKTKGDLAQEYIDSHEEKDYPGYLIALKKRAEELGTSVKELIDSSKDLDDLADMIEELIEK